MRETKRYKGLGESRSIKKTREGIKGKRFIGEGRKTPIVLPRSHLFPLPPSPGSFCRTSMTRIERSMIVLHSMVQLREYSPVLR